MSPTDLKFHVPGAVSPGMLGKGVASSGPRGTTGDPDTPGAGLGVTPGIPPTRDYFSVPRHGSPGTEKGAGGKTEEGKPVSTARVLTGRPVGLPRITFL